MTTMYLPPDLLEVYNAVQRENPSLLDAFYPRRLIATPTNYMHPKYYAPLWAASMGFLSYLQRTCPAGTIIEDIDRVKSMGYYVGCKLAKQSVPTYFVDSDLCVALLHTKPPSEFLLKDLHWPFDAMLFLIPEEFGIAFCGEPIYYLSVARFAVGERVAAPIEAHSPLRTVVIEQVHPCIGFHSSTLESMPDGSRQLSAYYFTAPMSADANIASCMLAYDKTVYYGYENPFLPATMQQFDQTKDGRIANQLTDLTLRIMLLMQAVPAAVTAGQCVRPARRLERNGHGQHALYEPTYIGRHFVTKREGTSMPTGTHASPVMHWRSGHWTHQPHGQGRKLRKLIWLQPVLVNKPQEQAQQP